MELPPHPVTINQHFAVSAREVTLGEWNACSWRLHAGRCRRCGKRCAAGHECELERRTDLCGLAQKNNGKGLSATHRGGMGIRSARAALAWQDILFLWQ